MKNIIFIILIIFLSGCGTNSNSDKNINREDGAVKLNIDLSGSLQNPSFSPDGNSIVFTRFRNGYNKEPADLYTYNLNTKNLKVLVSDGYSNVNLPGSSWNGDYVVYSSTKDPHDEIYKININSLEITKITNRSNDVAYEPTFNSDGSKVVFESHKLDIGNNGIITIFDMNNYIPLTDVDSDARQPNWSPANDKILFQKLQNDKWDLWVMDVDGANKYQVTSGSGDKTDASFINNEESMVFSGNINTDNANIYSIHINTKVVNRLTTFDGYDGAPSISLDNSKLTFESTKKINPDNTSGTLLWIKNL